jgi:Mrp family chromosome partitioning ATPase
MSALDRAFIRAYHRGKDAPGAASPHLAERHEDRLAEMATATAQTAGAFAATGDAVPLSRALADLTVANELVSTSIGALLDEAMQPEPTPLSAVFNPYSAPAATMTLRRIESPSTKPAQQPFVNRFDAAATATQALAMASTVQLPPPVQPVTTGSAAAKTWSPLLQVDRVVWPTIHNRLQGAAQAAIAQMADGLQAIGDSSRKIIGLASCARGEGVTTLLSAAARSLLERGRKVAIVDGHWSNPQLARCLGLLPQIGWEESLSGGLPLEEIVIESLADGLAVLPVREPPAGAVPKTAIAAGLETLARKYDFVLVDLGAMDDIAEEGNPARELASRMDAVVLVQNIRVTPPHRLAEGRKRLAAANARYAGTIQNFVAG